MTVKIWTKKETQNLIKQLREFGYDVKKINGLYKIYEGDKVWMLDGKPLFTAMVGNNGYLIQYHDSLIG